MRLVSGRRARPAALRSAMPPEGQTFAVVLNWNNYSDTVRCVEAIHRSSVLPTVVLVDNASEDGSFERLVRRYAGHPYVQLIRNDENYGFSRGVNVGINGALNAGARYLWLVNNDAFVSRQCLSRLLSALQDSPRIGFVGPAIYYYSQPRTLWPSAGQFSRIKTGVVTIKQRRRRQDPLTPRDVGFLSGCVLLIRREVFEVTGLFDDNLFFYGEDVDFSLRARAAGFRLRLVPRARAWHKIDAGRGARATPFAMYHLARSRLILLRKRFGSAYFFYAIAVHLAVYTPFRIWQARLARSRTSAVVAWFSGSASGLRHMCSGH